MHKIGLLLVGVMVLSGCSSTNIAAPNSFRGYYYMAGDADCVRFLPYEDKPAIQCLNAKGQLTTYRRAMTVEEMTLYQVTAARKEAADQRFYDGLAAGNRALQDFAYERY